MRSKVIRDGYAWYEDPRGSSYSPPVGWQTDGNGEPIGVPLSPCCAAPIVQEGGESRGRSLFQATDFTRWDAVDVCVQCGERLSPVRESRSGMIDGRSI